MVDDHKIQLEPGMIYFISPCHYRSFGYHSFEEVYVITLTEELEKENTELKKMFAEMSIENRALKNLIEKKL